MVMDSLDKALNGGGGGGGSNGGVVQPGAAVMSSGPVTGNGTGGVGNANDVITGAVVTSGMSLTPSAPNGVAGGPSPVVNVTPQQQQPSQMTPNNVVVVGGSSAPIAVQHPIQNSSSVNPSIVGGRLPGGGQVTGVGGGSSPPPPQYSRGNSTQMQQQPPNPLQQQQSMGVGMVPQPQQNVNKVHMAPPTNHMGAAHFGGGGGGDPLDTSKSMAAAMLGSMMPGGVSPAGGINGLNINYNDATEANKMFIGGLSWNTNDSMLYHHFSKFGEVVEHCVMRDAATQRSRGFGFVKFADADAVERVLNEPQPHIIDEKVVDPKRAVPKYQSKLINKTKKVFLGGLPPDTNNEDVQAHFSRFGEVEEVMLMYDRTTHRLRGFGFVKFALEEAAEAACREHYHEIKGKMVEAKKAQPKEAMTNLQLKKWSYGTTSITGAPADAGLPFYLSSSSQRNPMFAAAAVNNPGNPYNGGQFHPNFAYSPVMNYPGSPTFQVGSPIGAPMGSERTTTPNHFLFGDLIASPFNGQLPTRPTTMSPSPLDSFTRETFLSTLPYMGAGSPRATTGGITSPPLAAGLDTSHEFAGILATSPQTTGFQFGSPFGFGTVPPAMVAAYQGYNP